MAAVEKDPVPPQELVHQCEDLGKNINGHTPPHVFHARPYLSDGCEYSEPEWRIQIIDEQNIVVVQHLVPKYCDWHTIYLMLGAMLRYGRGQYLLGKEDAVNKITAHFKEIIK